MLPSVYVLSRFIPPAHKQKRLTIVSRRRFWSIPLGPVRKVR